MYNSCRDNVLHIEMLWWSDRFITDDDHILDKLPIWRQFNGWLALWPSGLGNYFVCKRFAVQTLLGSLKFVIQINLEHDISQLQNQWSINIKRITINYSTLFKRKTTIFKQKLQKDIRYCKSQNKCRMSNCMDKELSNFEWGISNNHEKFTWRYIFNLCCHYKFGTTSCPIMNQNETGLSAYGIITCV